MPQLRFHNLDNLPRPPGYTHVVEAIGPGRLIFIAGQLGQDRTGKLAPDLRGQTEVIFQNIDAALRLVGATFHDVVKLNTFLIDVLGGNPTYREVRDRYVNTAAPPAGTTIQVPALAREGALIEVDAVALLPA